MVGRLADDDIYVVFLGVGNCRDCSVSPMAGIQANQRDIAGRTWRVCCRNSQEALCKREITREEFLEMRRDLEEPSGQSG